MNKIVFVVPILAPYAILRFREMAKRNDMELHIIVEKGESKDRFGWKYQEIEGCHTYLLDKTYIHKFVNENESSGYSVNNTHMVSFGLRKLVKQINPDMVIVCNSVQIAMLSFHRGYRLGVIVEDTLRAAEGRKKINSQVKKLLLKQADCYFPFTPDAEAFLNANGINKDIYGTSWSIDVHFFRSITNVSHECSVLGIDTHKTNYIIVSSLIPLKGIKQFISGWLQMDNSFQEKSRLRIIGDGPLAEELSVFSASSSNISFLGKQKYEDVSRYLQCSDIFVLPTLQDLCSLSVFEGMAAGLPVLTTKYNGARFLVKDGINGYIFDSESEESIMVALEKISHSNLESMKKAAIEESNLFDNRIVMKQFGDQITGMLN